MYNTYSNVTIHYTTTDYELLNISWVRTALIASEILSTSSIGSSVFLSFLALFLMARAGSNRCCCTVLLPSPLHVGGASGALSFFSFFSLGAFFFLVLFFAFSFQTGVAFEGAFVFGHFALKAKQLRIFVNTRLLIRTLYSYHTQLHELPITTTSYKCLKLRCIRSKP
jgi:hypothetical protein